MACRSGCTRSRRTALPLSSWAGTLLRVEVEDTAGEVAIVRLGDRMVRARMPHGRPSRTALLCVRPHALAFSPEGRDNSFPATVQSAVWQGDLHSIELDVLGETARLVCTPMQEPPLPGSQVQVHYATDEAVLIPDEPP